MLKDCKYFEGTGNFCARVTAMRCDEFPECEFKYIAELKAENETLKSQLDFEVQKKEVLEAENERLKEELTTYGATGVCEVCSDKANKLTDKYLGYLQEIKEIAECVIDNDNSLKTDHCFGYCDECSSFKYCKLYPYWQIIQLITKAESEG